MADEPKSEGLPAHTRDEARCTVLLADLMLSLHISALMWPAMPPLQAACDGTAQILLSLRDLEDCSTAGHVSLSYSEQQPGRALRPLKHGIRRQSPGGGRALPEAETGPALHQMWPWLVSLEMP